MELLNSEKDKEMLEFAKQELSASETNIEQLEHEIKILLLPKDPNDEKECNRGN